MVFVVDFQFSGIKPQFMKKKKQLLKDRLWAVAMEYARLTADVLGLDVEYWVADEVSVSCCCFGDVQFLDLEEMQIIIDHLDNWIEKYGSKEKVGEVVNNWSEWCLEDAYNAEKDEWRDHPRINLWSWLKGLRPEQLK